MMFLRALLAPIRIFFIISSIVMNVIFQSILFLKHNAIVSVNDSSIIPHRQSF